MSGATLIRVFLVALILAGICGAAAHWDAFTVEGLEDWVDSFGG